MPQDAPLLTANQVVAHNLRAARELRGLTQAEAAALLEPFIGERWSVAVFSAAERSVVGTRVRVFDADLIHAFARAFGLPIGWFFLPPDAATVIGTDGATEAPTKAAEQISLATWVSDEIRERIDEITRQLPAADRARLLRGDPGGMSESALVGAAVAQAKTQLEALVAEVQAQIETLDALAHA